MARNEPRRACAHAASGGGVAGRMQVTNPSSGVVLLTQNPATDASSLRVSDTSRRVLSATSKLTRGAEEHSLHTHSEGPVYKKQLETFPSGRVQMGCLSLSFGFNTECTATHRLLRCAATPLGTIERTH